MTASRPPIMVAAVPTVVKIVGSIVCFLSALYYTRRTAVCVLFL